MANQSYLEGRGGERSGTAPWELKPSGAEMGQETWALKVTSSELLSVPKEQKTQEGVRSFVEFSHSQEETQTSKKHGIQKATPSFGSLALPGAAGRQTGLVDF